MTKGPLPPFDPGAMIYSGGPCPICREETLITRRLMADPADPTGLDYRESTDCGCHERRSTAELDPS